MHTPEQHPRQAENDDVGREVKGGIGVIEVWLVEASPLDGLVPVEVDGTALQKQGDGEGALLDADERRQPVERLPCVMNSRETPDEEQHNGHLYGEERWRVDDLGSKATLQRKQLVLAVLLTRRWGSCNSLLHEDARLRRDGPDVVAESILHSCQQSADDDDWTDGSVDLPKPVAMQSPRYNTY